MFFNFISEGDPKAVMSPVATMLPLGLILTLSKQYPEVLAAPDGL